MILKADTLSIPIQKLCRLCNTQNLLAQDNFGTTPLMFALKYNQKLAIHLTLENFELLIKNSDLSQKNTDGQTPFMLWCENNKKQEINLSPELFDLLLPLSVQESELTKFDTRQSCAASYYVNNQETQNLNACTNLQFQELAKTIVKNQKEYLRLQIEKQKKIEHDSKLTIITNPLMIKTEAHEIALQISYFKAFFDNPTEDTWIEGMRKLGSVSPKRFIQIFSTPLPTEENELNLTYAGKMFKNAQYENFLKSLIANGEDQVLHLELEKGQSVLKYFVGIQDFFSYEAEQNKFLLSIIQSNLGEAYREEIFYDPEYTLDMIKPSIERENFISNFYMNKCTSSIVKNSILELKSNLIELLEENLKPEASLSPQDIKALGEKAGELIEDFENKKFVPSQYLLNKYNYCAFLTYSDVFRGEKYIKKNESVHFLQGWAAKRVFGPTERSMIIGALSSRWFNENYDFIPFLQSYQSKLEKDLIVREKLELENIIISKALSPQETMNKKTKKI